MSRFALDYAIMVFIASVGAIQVAASLGGLRGLMFLPSRVACRVLGAALIVGALVWFFASGERNINDYEGGLDANVQALFFFLSAAAAYLFTLAVSSLLNFSLRDGDPSPYEGLEALKKTNYARAVAWNLRFWSKQWRRMKSYFSG